MDNDNYSVLYSARMKGPLKPIQGFWPLAPPSPAPPPPVHFHDVNNSKPSLSCYVITTTNRETSQSGTLYMYICQCMLPLQRSKKFLLVLHPRIKIISKKVFSYTHTHKDHNWPTCYTHNSPFFLFSFFTFQSVWKISEISDTWLSWQTRRHWRWQALPLSNAPESALLRSCWMETRPCRSIDNSSACEQALALTHFLLYWTKYRMQTWFSS